MIMRAGRWTEAPWSTFTHSRNKNSLFTSINHVDYSIIHTNFAQSALIVQKVQLKQARAQLGLYHSELLLPFSCIATTNVLLWSCSHITSLTPQPEFSGRKRGFLAGLLGWQWLSLCCCGSILDAILRVCVRVCLRKEKPAAFSSLFFGACSFAVSLFSLQGSCGM